MRLLGCWPSTWLYSPGTTSSENLAFHSDKMGGKDHCRVTTGRLKPGIPRNVCLFIQLQLISVINIILSNNAFDITISCLLLRPVFILF